MSATPPTVTRDPNGHRRVRTTIRLRAELDAWLRARAKKNKRTFSAELQRVLEHTRSREASSS
jgi:hypothetical protein